MKSYPSHQWGLMISTLLIGFFLLLGFLSCSPIDRFSEYRGVNLLEGKSLGDWIPDFNEASTPTPANPGISVYMRYEQVGPTAGYGGSEAYRLRTKNLFPNGDFEGGNTSGWSSYGSGSTSFSLTSLSSEAIQGTSFKYTIAASTDYIYFPLSSLLDGFLPTSADQTIQYTYRFDLKFPGAPTLSFDVNVNPTSDNSRFVQLQKKGELPYYRYPIDFPESPLTQSIFRSSNTEAYYFFLNTPLDSKGNAQTGILDNLRFLRSDLQYKIRLVLPRNDPNNPNRLPLPSGKYRFSFYVKQDPEAGSNNVFPASRISFGIGTASKIVDATSIQSEWILLEGTFNNLQIDPGSSIELWISATDSTNAFYRDCGSILISSPSLEFLPD
ncbi:MAG: hypothetical protein N2442_03730 [Spirochaetes bacterium]|nr:hypothetical protein [Spirochaetota bacterium]